MVPSKIKIESFAKRCHMGTLGGKGLMFMAFDLCIVAIVLLILMQIIDGFSL